MSGDLARRLRGSGGRRLARAVVAAALAAASLAADPAPAAGAGFADLPAGHWAVQAVERMAAKGIVQGLERDGKAVFEPDRAVTRWEALALLVRGLGLEESARRRTSIPAAFREAATVPQWAFGYVAEAVERGILAGPELAALQGGGRASRLQVAGWLVRGLGLAGEAASAPAPPFADLGGLDAAQAGVVALVAETGLMTGAQGRFRPGDPVTRAEMAVLLERVDRLLDNALDAAEATGRVEDTAGGLVLQTAAGQRVLGLPDDAVVFFEGMRATRAFLAKGDTVNVVADAQGRARFVEVITKPLAAEGEVLAVGPGLRLRLDDGAEQSYNLAAGVLVLLDDRPASPRRLAPGMRASVEGRKDAVTRVVAWSRVDEMRGELQSLARVDPDYLLHLAVRQAGGGTEDRVFTIPAGVRVTRDGQPADLADLRVRDRVTLALRGGRVFSVAAESFERTLSGTLRGIGFGARVELTIEVERAGGAARVETFPVKDGAAVRKDDRPAGLTGLRPGDRVEFTVTGDDITRLEARTQYTEVEGTLVRVTIANPPEVAVRTRDGAEKSFPVAPDVTVRLGGAAASLLDLRPGQPVVLSVAYGQVAAVKAAAWAALDDVRGVVRYVDFQEGSFVLELADGRGNRNVKAGSPFLVVRAGQVYDRLSRLEPGDVVVVVGRDVPGASFEAQVVVVTGSAR